MNSYQLEPEDNKHVVIVEDALSGWEFIDNRGRSVANWLRSYLPQAASARICVAYFTPTGLEVIKAELEDFLGKGGHLSTITSEEIAKVTRGFYSNWLKDTLASRQGSIQPTLLLCIARCTCWRTT